jgi:hypothetical protein
MPQVHKSAETSFRVSEPFATDILLQEIVHGLKNEFYYHLKSPISEKTFDSIVQSLGTVIRTEAVRLHASTRLLHQPEALKYHTDQPYVDIVAWQCIVPDPDGPTLLLNMAQLLNSFNSTELDLLRQIVVMSPNPDDLSDLTPEPLLKIEDGCLRLFYISFRGSKKMSLELQQVWSRFKQYVEDRARDSAFGVVLKKDECLFLHNKTFFHARPAISSESKRFLNRIWIQSELVKGVRVNPPCTNAIQAAELG